MHSHNLLIQSIFFGVISVRRRVKQQCYLWISMAGGVSLVVIGSGLATKFDFDSTAQRINFGMASTVLEWCAITVVSINGIILSLRIMQSDHVLFRTLFTLGIPPRAIAGIRAVEFFLGLSVSILIGTVVAVLTLHFAFSVPMTNLDLAVFRWVIPVGFLPMILVPFASHMCQSSLNLKRK